MSLSFSTIKKLIGAGLIALAGFLNFYLNIPAYTNIKNLKLAILDRKDAVEQKIELIARVRLLDEQYSQRLDEIQKLSTLFPQEKKIQEILSSISSMAQDSGMELRNIITKIKEDTEKNMEGKTGMILVEISIAGQYPSFVNFLSLLEKNLRIFDVKDIGASIESASGNIIDFRIIFETYYVRKEVKPVL